MEKYKIYSNFARNKKLASKKRNEEKSRAERAKDKKL